MDGNTNITCTVCGENDFHLKEGYYYCNECGTKTEQVRAVEVERDDEFADVKRRKTLKIKTNDKSNKPQLTSWECYNYILRGIVEELLDLGAKDEIKAMTLQIWAAYLRTIEVAFFSRTNAELPKLGIRFERRDAAILYNHAKQRKKVKRAGSNTPSVASSRREWRKQMKNFDQSQYEASMQSNASQSNTSMSSLGGSSLSSSSSAASNRAIQLKFSTNARKRLKKQMPPAHLRKHEQDCDQVLTCHNIRAKRRELNYGEASMELKLKQLYAIIAIALNLTEDDIQVTDLMRFIAEGHISSFKVQQFFPDNISEHCKDTLASYRFHLQGLHFTVASIREQASILSKAIHIRSLKTPDISKLTQRYITELCLPSDIYILIERLINLYPPKMNWDSQHSMPCYETRAMAYIIFTLKLLFGLDGRKEKEISKSAKKVNAQLSTMGIESSKELFVWQDWVEYIEMRKVILCNHNLAICKQFKQIPPREMYLQHMTDRCEIGEKAVSKDQKKKQENMLIVFNRFLKTNVGDEKPLEASKETKFTPSFTPCYNYFKHIQLDANTAATIPDSMRVDHSIRSLMPLLSPKPLQKLFAQNGRNLNVMHVECTSRRSLAGTFRNPFLCNITKQSRKVNFNTDNNEWEARLQDDKTQDTIFKSDMERYCRKTLQNFRKKLDKTLSLNCTSPSKDISVSKDILSYNKSIDLFDESDMEPADVCLTAPRRNLEKINLFAGISDDEYEVQEDQSQDENFIEGLETTTLKISNMDCWVLMGKAFELNEVQSIELKSKLPLTFVWLLEICANTLAVEWTELYDQVMLLETFFTHAIESLNEFEDRLIFKDDGEIKDINKIVRHFKAYW